MFNARGRPGLFHYVKSTTLPHIPNIVGMPAIPPPGHKSHKNNLTVRSEAWRRLENIYQIDPMGFAQQILTWASHTIKDMPFKHEDPHMVERLSLGTRREDGLPDQLDHPMDTIDRLGAFLDTLPLMSAQRLFHILYPDTLLWRFQLHQGFDIDQTIFDYFLWTRTQRSDEEPQNRLVVAYQPPWILTQADFEEFVRCGSLPPHVTPGHAYPPDLLSKHRVWAKLWDICVQNNTKWFVVTSWNVWAFGGFSDGWCSGIISDIWHLDEHTPSILECLTFWMASAMERKGSYRRPQVPEPLNALRTEIMLPVHQVEISKPVVSESNWKGKSQDAPTSAHLTSLSDSLSYHGVEDYEAPLTEREKHNPTEFIEQWRDSIVKNQEDISGGRKKLTVNNGRVPITCSHGEWLL